MTDSPHKVRTLLSGINLCPCEASEKKKRLESTAGKCSYCPGSTAGGKPLKTWDSGAKFGAKSSTSHLQMVVFVKRPENFAECDSGVVKFETRREIGWRIGLFWMCTHEELKLLWLTGVMVASFL